MAKNVYFSEETMKGIDRLVTTEDGRAVVDYGKGNFLLGATTAVAYGVFAWGVVEAVKLGTLIYKYMKS